MSDTIFIGENFLLQNETARVLYHDYARQMPIIDYHCHLPVQEIADDYRFKNLTDIWLRGDHYKWRAMRTLGVEEKFITGDASDLEKFRRWAEVVPYTLRNPLYHWTQMELKNPFGVTELLQQENADDIYEHCNTLLKGPGFSTRGLLGHFHVKAVCTTDDPCDDLAYHGQIAAGNFKIKVLPAFRPDKVLNLAGGKPFLAYLDRLAEISGVSIVDVDSLLDALQSRIDYFHARGARLADHGLSRIPLHQPHRIGEIEKAFKGVLQGTAAVGDDLSEAYAGYILFHLCSMYHQKGWVQQFHLGALRNVNEASLNTYGPDTGFDSIGDYSHAASMAKMFNDLNLENRLTKTILYNLNPADNEVFATMTGNFNEGPAKAKMQYGSAWWFLDQLDGMEKQINTLSNMGILSCFVGMLTDSRSFLSYSRHEYFRRLLCNIFGKDVEAGLLPKDEKWLGKIIRDICYNNAESYFDFGVTHEHSKLEKTA